MHIGYGMVKLVKPQEEMRTKTGRKKFITFTRPIEGYCHMPHRATGGSTNVSQEAEKSSEGNPSPEFLLQFLRKGKAGRVTV